MKIWIERENLDETKKFNAYIFKMAHNEVVDNFRKLSKEQTLMPEIIW
jgi:DNA-directed RNA polymerase specialized sigma24 family protein